MAEFSTTDAALEGFRIARENPRAVAVWWLVELVGLAVMTAILAQNGAVASLEAMQSAAASPTADPAAAMRQSAEAIGKLMTGVAPLFLVQVLVQAGILRVILAPDGRRAPLAFGGDEVRVLGVSLITSAAVSVTGVILGVILGVLGALASAALGPLLMVVGMVAALIVISVRLSLLPPMAVGGGRINPAEAWRMTNGRFHAILAPLAIAFVLGMVILVLGGLVVDAAAALTGLKSANPATLAEAFSVGGIVVLILQALLQVLSSVVMIAPAAIIYRSLANPTRQAEVF